MHLGLHHYSRRHRIQSPTDNESLVRGIDIAAYTITVITLLFTIDQVRIIWFNHDASGVSLLAWISYTVASVVWFMYGHLHKDRVIVVTNFFWIIFSVLIVIGVLLYRT